MPNSNEIPKSVKSSLFVDYKPAELKIGTQWLVVYYAKNPITKIMQRFRVVVPVITPKSERIKHGKKIAEEINKKLYENWLPFYSEVSSNDFKTYEYCKKQFMEQLQADITKGNRRADTERTYKSYFTMFEFYISKKALKLDFLFEINRSFINNYLDFILYERNNGHRTYNNHLGFFIGFINFCLARGFVKENCAIRIAKKKEGEKIRQVLTVPVKNKIKLLETIDFNYYALCMTTYFCFVRRTELTKLLAMHVDLENYSITIPTNISKNHKEETITIPNAFLPIIKKQLKNTIATDFLFSDNDFLPGKKQLAPRKISGVWEKYRKLLDIEKMYQFYSLKDTGITDLLISGVPAIKVRNQARHGEISTTEKYTARSKNCDEIVQNANFNF